LYKKLSDLAADLAAQTLPEYVAGKIKPREQNHTQATFTKLLTKDDGRIDWTRQSGEISNQIRALNPEPGTWTKLDGKIVKILAAEPLEDHKIELPGKLYKVIPGLAAKTANSGLLLLEVQPEGKKPMSGKDFANGLKNLEMKHFI
jgi:methionyl-tRNA formyltransferase